MVEKSKNQNKLDRIFNILLILIIISIYFLPIAMAANPQIKLTTNRYIILDDPNKNYASVTANADTDFGLPGSWNTDAWNGESTTIRGVALVLNANGTPASGVTVTFSVQDWADPIPRTLKSDTNNKINVTNADGLATVPFNLNNEQQYGRWKVTATATVAGTPVSSTSNFVYNWWGCQNCHGNPYSGSGSSKSYTSRIGTSNRYDPYSPYITGRDFHATMYRSDHVAGSSGGLNEGECWACHNSYDKDLNLGQAKDVNGNTYAGKDAPSTYGVHTNLSCDQCHSIIGTSSAGVDQTVKSCDATGCHTGATDFNSHIGPETVTAASPNKYVNYSGLDATLGIRSFGTPSYIPTPATFNSNPLAGARAHTSATVQNIPCTVCHGPMHNVTKPNINTVAKNTITEDTQCTTCHQSLKHSSNNPVYCTACHSQDAHNITVLSKTATSQPSYVFLGSTNAVNSSTTDCEQCHAPGPEATFFSSLTTVDSAAYSVNFAPATPIHNRHNGTVACSVCHDNTNFHDIKFLQPNGAYSTSKTTAVKCVDCHDGTNSAVRSVVQTKFGSLPPTVNANMNHSSDNGGQKWGNYWTTANDACLYCHGETQHNTSAIGAAGSALGTDKVGDPIGSGTVCSSCHNQDDSNYNVVNSLTPKPPANKPGVNYPSSGAVDHSSYGLTDNDCKNCHGSNLVGGENMVGFTHNVAPGGGGGSCTGCHAQPPNGASRYNTQGAHSLHSSAGYGNVEITGCNYCHSTEGVNEAGHPGTFNDATIVPNASVTITTYTQNTSSGKDDTCSGVSCHNKSLPSNAVAGIATWDSTTSGQCNVCHSTSATGVPATDDHLIHNATKGYTCTSCHNGATHFNGGNAEIGFSGLANNSGYSTNWNQGTQTCTVYCHDPNGAANAGGDAYAVWTNTTGRTCTSCHGYPPTVTRTGASHTSSTNCDGCHGTNASLGTQAGHINGNVEIAGGSCTACHTQPPTGIVSPDTQGAHTLHASAGYGNVAQTSCAYCHSNGGTNDGGSHPNSVTNVSTNASASIATYTKNPTGKDDTCSGVSCHNKSLPSNAVAGTATWDSTTQGRCDVCHSTSATGVPATDDHLIHNATKGYTCTNCHNGATHFNGGNAEIGFSGLANNSGYSTNWNQGTQTCSVYCHDPNGPANAGGDAYAVWTNTTDRTCTSCHGYPPTVTRSGSSHPANSNCNDCHGDGATTGTHAGHINGVVNGGGASCTGCHSNVNSTSLGLHSNLNGTSTVDDGDCTTCHYASFPMVTGAANSTNTYYCEDCHTTGGTGPVKSTLLKDGLDHGSTDCKWCHAAADQPDYKYHLIGPRGTATGQNCVTCHYYSNLSALPFRAPGETHSNKDCSGCHPDADYHYTPIVTGTPPTITQPTINGFSGTTSVTSGIHAYIQATVSDDGMVISAAQYRITNGALIVKDWTNMTGAFNSNYVVVSATLDTTSLIGTYTVNVKGMASGPGSGPNYPLNGQWSSIASTQLIVTESKGYINGTIRNNSVNIPGAVITTNTGVTAISDANGFYSLSLTNGTYQLTTVKEPEFYTNSSVSVTVTAPETIIREIILNKKPTGTISGIVTVK